MNIIRNSTVLREKSGNVVVFDMILLMPRSSRYDTNHSSPNGENWQSFLPDIVKTKIIDIDDSLYWID